MKKRVEVESLPVHEQHYRGALRQSWVATDHVHSRGITPLYQERSDETYVTPEMRHRALAAVANADVSRRGYVLVNYQDSENAELNDQNAPLDGNARTVDGRLPKVKTGRTRNYGWEE